MGKMKESAPKGKKNPSSAMVKQDPNERTAREAAIAALAMQGFEKVEAKAEGEIQEMDVVDKEALEGVSLIVVDVKENTSDFPDPETGDYGTYLFVTCLCEDGKVRAFIDGGMGIRGQLQALLGIIDPRKPETCVRCPGGLKPSKEYQNSVNGAPTVTWRLAQHEKKDKSIRAQGNSGGRARAQA